MTDFKVGLGFDVHRFSKKNTPLILGGKKIKNTRGLEAISDGDVVLHAIADAICGACSLGDIGDYFPPSKKFIGLDSKKIVEFILKKINKKFKIINIDVIIIADKPKLAPFKEKILDSLKKIFKVNQINIKIKSKENLNILGSKNSISCLANCLVKVC
ncbi:MAG: 2-C-methyl-D-erythritol 2,4-cyclodiphosphate synthase [Candidatus Omnitrophica bacterium]|nr:2-C-methyl-D-erythritol 2,4-cyclodiphosphate synthase [Candidatus Omnitrophota bacterium]